MNTFSFLRNIAGVLHRIDLFSLGVAGTALYFIFFALTPLLEAVGISVGIPHAVPLSRETVSLIAVGFVCFLGGYLAFPRSLVQKVPNVLRGAWLPRRVPCVVGALVAVGAAGTIVQAVGGGYSHTDRSAAFLSSPFASVFGYLDLVALLALGMALLWYFFLKRAGDSRAARWGVIAGALLGVQFVVALFSCGRAEALSVVLLYLIARWYVLGMEPWKAFLSLAVAAVIVFPFGNVCRNPVVLNSAQAPAGDAPSPLAVISHLPSLATQSFFSRINQSFVFSQVIARDLSDFKSDVVTDILVNFGPPRFLWSEKPMSINARGNELGHRLGVLAPDDRHTAVGPTILGDLFINFGVWGLALGMALFGVLARVLYSYFIQGSGASLSGVLAYSIVFVEFLEGMEGWIVPSLAGLIKLLIVLAVIHLIIRMSEPREQTA